MLLPGNFGIMKPSRGIWLGKAGGGFYRVDKKLALVLKIIDHSMMGGHVGALVLVDGKVGSCWADDLEEVEQ